MGRLSREAEKMKAAAMPGSTAWEMASPIMLILRSTRKLPGSAHAHEQSTAMTMTHPS
jgi:hypothetical protein